LQKHDGIGELRVSQLLKDLDTGLRAILKLFIDPLWAMAFFSISLVMLSTVTKREPDWFFGFVKGSGHWSCTGDLRVMRD
jgi:hypothetical protein